MRIEIIFWLLNLSIMMLFVEQTRLHHRVCSTSRLNFPNHLPLYHVCTNNHSSLSNTSDHRRQHRRRFGIVSPSRRNCRAVSEVPAGLLLHTLFQATRHSQMEFQSRGKNA